MERQRLAEWEKQRKAELVQHRQREQEKVLELKAKKENLDTEFETMVRMISLKLGAKLVKLFLYTSDKCLTLNFHSFRFSVTRSRH